LFDPARSEAQCRIDKRPTTGSWAPPIEQGCERRELKPEPEEQDDGNSAAIPKVNGDEMAERPPPNPAMAGRLDASLDASDPVEAALADALAKASAAGQWGVVGQLVRELESRRSARAGAVDIRAVGRGRR